MSSPNPRKFSEKIAILTRKQNEDQKEYEKIMGEVRPLTHNANIPSTSQGLGPHPAMWPARPGGSLPNVHEMVQPGSAVAMPHIDPAYMGWPAHAGIWPGNEPQRVMHSGGHRARSPGAHQRTHYHPYSSHSPGSSPRQRSPDRPMGPIYTPFPNTVPVNVAQQLLDIPEGWRRTHSDPGINATLGAVGSQNHQSSSPSHTPPQMHTPPGGGSPQAQGTNFYLDPKGVQDGGGQSRPQSCENSPNIPILSITQSNGVSDSPAGLMISSSGSLPDLPSRLPLDYCQSGNSAPGMVSQPPMYNQGDQQNQGSSNPLHLQRHSIQFPVMVSPQFSPTGYCNIQTNSPSYTLAATPPYGGESQSAPNSPGASGGPADSSPVSSPTSAAVAGMTTGLKNFTMGTNSQQSDWNQLHQQSLYQHQFLQNHQQYAPNSDIGMQCYSSGQPAMSPKGGIPNIILTGDDGSVCGAATTVTSISDPALDVFSDLNMTLDANDLQMLMNNAAVDADDEDALRRD